MDEASLIKQLKAGSPSVLLIDDDLHITQGLKDILEDSGYGVEIAHSGEEAERVLADHSFSVLVIDYSLPDTNGIELARKLLALHPRLQVILMTGHDRFDMQPHDMSTLFTAFLRKPVEIQAVTGAIEHAVRAQCERLNLPVFDIRPSDPSAPAAAAVDDNDSRQKIQASLKERFAPARPLRGTSLIVLFIVGFGGGWIAKSVKLPEFRRRQLSPRLAMRVPPAKAVAAALRPPIAASPVPPLPSSLRAAALKAQHLSSTRKFRNRPVIAKAAPPVPVSSAAVASTLSAAGPDYDAKLSQADFSVRLVAAKALLKAEPDHARAIDALLAMMQDPDSAHRLSAVETLSVVRVQTPATVSAMAGRLSDSDPAVAFAAATALGHMGPAAVPAIPPLTQALISPARQGPSIAHAAEDALVQIGKPGVPALIQKLDDTAVRRNVMLVLGRMGPEASTALPVIDSLTSDPSIGATALEAREKIQGNSGERKLSEKSTDASTTTKTTSL